jgi:hypothetical protein
MASGVNISALRLLNPPPRLISSFDPLMVKSVAALVRRRHRGLDEKKLTFAAASRP